MFSPVAVALELGGGHGNVDESATEEGTVGYYVQLEALSCIQQRLPFPVLVGKGLGHHDVYLGKSSSTGSCRYLNPCPFPPTFSAIFTTCSMSV